MDLVLKVLFLKSLKLIGKMEYSLLQKKLWKIGGYKAFALKHCPILYNEIAGIGALFTFQLIIVFFSTIAFSSVFKIDWLLFGIPLGIINVLIFNFWSKLLLKFIHRYLNWGALILICLLKSIFSLIISLPFILFLFESQALYQLLLIKGKINLGFWEQFSLKPYGLYLSWFSESEGTIILIFSFAIFIMVLFISIAPYFLILRGRKSVYQSILKIYEERFN